VEKESKQSVREKVMESLPEKARQAKQEHDTEMAQYAKDYQKDLYNKNGKRGTLSSMKLILEVKTLWEAGVYTSKEIAEEIGCSHQAIKSIVAALNKTQFRSPAVRALAIRATKDILKSCPDDNIRLKMISKIFPDEEVKQSGSGVSVNLNIKGSELALKNPNFDYVDMEEF
jgi:hypothetical protein